MLQGFRSFTNSVVGKALFAVLILTFGLLGVGYGLRDLVLGRSQSTEAATVGDTKISLMELDRDYRRQLAGLQRQLGANFNPTPAQKQELARASLEQQITDALFADAARADGIRVTDELIRDEIQKQPAFADSAGRFDRAKFQFFLQNQGYTEGGFVALLRRDIARQLLVAPIGGSAVAPKALVEDMYRYRNEVRVAETVRLADADATGIPAPTDADLAAYHQKHAADFTLPEYRTFTVLPLTPELFMGEITPGEDELKAAYEQHKADYVVPETRTIDQVVVQDKATAEAIAKAAIAGKSLTDAAKAATAGKVQPVTLGPLRKDSFPEALREPVFIPAKGSLVGPIETPLGWHVIRIDDVQAGHSIGFDEAKPKLTEELKREGAADRLAEQVDKLGDKLMGGTPMEQVASGVNAQLVKVGPVDANGNPPPGAPVPKDANPSWIAAAFQAQPNEVGPFQEGKDGSYFALKVTNVTAPALRPLADVRADVTARWTAEQRAAATAKRAQQLVAKAKAGTPMAQIATDAKAKVETVTLTRDAGGSQAALASALFALDKVGDVSNVQVPDGQIVVRLSEIRPADPKAPGAQLDTVARELNRGLQADEVAEYRAGLRESHAIKINPRAVELVAGQ